MSIAPRVSTGINFAEFRHFAISSAGGMQMTLNYHFTTPDRPLAGFVERFWHLSDAPSHSKERIMPSGTMELVINLHEDEVRIYDGKCPERCKRFSGSVVAGPYGGPLVIDTREHAAIIGIHFKPGGAFPFLGVAANELANSHVDLAALWGPSAVELRERLHEAAIPLERLHILERALMDHLFRPLERHPAVSFALHAWERNESDLSVGEVAREAGVSHRRFIQLFERETGMSPKLFFRVRRFQRALASAQRRAGPDWARLALEAGYCDQSHFIRDFQIFSDLSPGEYGRQRSEDVMQNHVPIAG
jgi:AraC-like DNA-binding protein